MAITTPIPSRGFLVVLLAGALGCGASDLVLPDPPGAENVLLSKYDGDGQEGTVGEPLPEPLVAQVLTDRQQPAIGRRVEFVITSPAEVDSPDTVVTNSDGLAMMNLTLGTSPGSYVIRAKLVTGEVESQTQDFTAAAKPAAPDTLGTLSPINQPGRMGQKVPDASSPRVRVVDRFGNPVPEVPVAWQVISGEGQVSEAISRTQADGTTGVEWTLGNRIGVQKLTATIEHATGSPAIFSATVFF